MTLDIKQKINEFISKRPEYALYKESELLSIMQDLGEITAKDVELMNSASLFGLGFENKTFEYGLNIEKTTNIQPPLKPEEKTSPTKQKITLPEKTMARAYVAQILFQQALQLYDLYYQTATNRSFGNEGMMELQELGASIVKGFDLGKNLGIKTPDSRDEIYKLVNTFATDCLKMINCPEAEFEKLFKYYCGKDIDYNNIVEYIESSMKFSNAPDSEKLNPESEIVKKLKNTDKNFQELISTKISKRVEDWSGNTLNYGGLVSLGFDMALLYGTGGFAAIGKASMFTGEAIQTAMKTALKNIGMKKSVAPVIEQIAGITASQLSGAALSSTAFQTTKVIDAVADGKVTTEEGAILSESAIGLFKFGYIGSAISGPLGAQVAQLTSRTLNSAPVIKQVIKTAITNKPMPLTNILKSLSEHSNAVSAITKFGTEFSINAGYMAVVDGLSYEEALGNLAEMDAVSKMVAAFMGGKNTAFLTPQKIQQVKTKIAGLNVKLSVYKGEKVFSITDKNGKVTHLANETELIMFVADKIINEVKVEQPQKAQTPTLKTLDSTIQKELTDAEFIEFKTNLAKKIKTLPKNKQTRFETYLSREDLIHKHNIQLLDKIISDKNLVNNEHFSNLVSCVGNSYQAKLLDLYIDNYDILKENNNLSWHISQIIRKCNTKESFDVTFKLFEKILTNEKYAKNPKIGNILKEAKSLEETEKMITFVEKYSITESELSYIEQAQDKTFANNFLEGLAQAKEKLGLEFGHFEIQHNLRQELFIIMRDYKTNIYLRFDEKTGKLVSISDKTTNFNLENNTIIISTPEKIIFDKDALPGEQDKLLSTKTAQYNSDGSLLQTLFKESQIKGEFELYEIAPNGKNIKLDSQNLIKMVDVILKNT